MNLRAAVRRWYKPAVIASLAAAAGALTLASGGTGPGEGLLFDVLVYARSYIAVPVAADASAVAVVAIDQESLDAEELKDRPRALMAPEWAKIVEGLIAAGAQVVGFDVIFAYSGNQLVADFDAPLLETLARHRDRVVLARSEATVPYIAYLGALGALEDPDRLGMASLDPDTDGVFRRVRNALPTGEPTLTEVVMRRAGRAMPPVTLIAPRRHLESIPTYAMADVLRCAEKDPRALAAAFKGRIVIVGGTHPDEDRKPSSSRWLSPPIDKEPPLSACGLRRLPASAPHAKTVPGVFIHAGALDAVVSGRPTLTAPRPAVALLSGGMAVAGGWFGLFLPPLATAGAVLFAGIVLFGLGTAALESDVWIPLVLPLATLVVAPLVAYVLRYLFEERLRQRIAEAFTAFAPRHLVEQLAEDPSALKFGGDARDVSVMFADLVGSTALSTRLPPGELMQIVNDHLATIADAVEATGGYVDKFIGDAVMGLWGAPVSHAQPALGAVRAAMIAERAITEMNAGAAADRKLSIKIGINSGSAIVGLVGTPHRYNYTAVGEIVNLAARLESIPGLYACRVALGEETARLVADDVLLRELDRVLVKGAAAPIRVYEPIAELSAATTEQQLAAKRYAEALALYRAMRFEEAAKIWDQLATPEPPNPLAHAGHPVNPPGVMAQRARELAASPPPADWDGVTVLTSK